MSMHETVPHMSVAGFAVHGTAKDVRQADE